VRANGWAPPCAPCWPSAHRRCENLSDTEESIITPTLTWDDKIAILDLGEDENRFSPEFLDAVNARLDDIEGAGAQGLVTTGRDKFYSNGLDLDWLAAHAEQAQSYIGRVQALLARVLTFPMPTAAAVTGHAFGAGAMLAIAHDVRVMRADRGYFCFPEVDIRIPFSDGMAALIQAKLTPRAAVASMTTGRRFGGMEAAEFGIVDTNAAEGAVIAAATEMLRPLAGKDPGTLGAIKRTMFRAAAQALTPA
jgi:enoyl-CoA hydratase/carnithine racemase